VGHARSAFRSHDPHFRTEPYDKWNAYASAKTANALFAKGLDTRMASEGLRAFSLHPGGILTPLQRHMPREELEAFGWVTDKDGQIPAGFKTPEQGAATSVWCAVSPQLDGRGGLYCEDCDVAKRAGPDSPRWAHVRSHAVDDEAGNNLWWLSEYETGLKFG
jgi:NAD(P)-dependent dehydrogenase (short-subunit alcohol dehydrogenase family)